MKKIIFTILTFLLPIGLFAQDGVLDPTFDSDGKVTTSIGLSAIGQSVVIQSDGKIIVAGYSYNGSNDDFAIVRYNSNGSLDNTFDSDGKVTTPIGSANDKGKSVALQSDGKIVVAGHTNNGSNDDFAIVRYNSDGSLDNTFDSDGKVTTPIGSGFDYGFSVAIQPDGKIVVAGEFYNGSNFDFAIVRYNIDGSLDNSFDSDGKVTTPIGSNTDVGRSVAIQSDGKIVVAGYSDNVSNRVFAIVRYNSDGSLDNSFDSDGKVTTSIGSNTDIGQSLALQSDGKIVVAGYSNNGSSNDFALVRYNSDGSLDNSFDSDGKVTTSIGSINDLGRSVAIQSDGKIIVAGESDNGSTETFAIVRYNSDGSLDNSFDSDGKVTTPIGSYSDYVFGVAIQSDGKIVVAGDSDNGSTGSDFAVARYNNPSLPVELTTFTANVNESSVQLNWETATEVNNYGFEVERHASTSLSMTDQFIPSGDEGWNKIGFVEGHGNSNSPKYYSHADKEVSSGKYNYRLKQIDIDGSYEYSDIVEIDLGLPSEFSLSQNFPNPFNPTTTISYSIPSVASTTDLYLKVYDVLGKEVATLVNDQQGPGNYKVEFDGTQLSSGIYYFQLKSGDFLKTMRMTLLK